MVLCSISIHGITHNWLIYVCSTWSVGARKLFCYATLYIVLRHFCNTLCVSMCVCISCYLSKEVLYVIKFMA